MRLADLSPKDVYAWRLTIPEGHRFEATQALRQVLTRAGVWGLIDYNPAKRGVPNPQRRSKEKRPFESWQQIEAVAARLGPVYGPMVVFAPRPGFDPRSCSRSSIGTSIEHLALCTCGGRTRTAGRSTPRRGSARGPFRCRRKRLRHSIVFRHREDLFANARGGHIDFRSFGRRHWKPAQTKAGSNRCVISTTCATPTPPSPSAPASRCSRSPVSWAPASR